jgi:hypothetical protein
MNKYELVAFLGSIGVSGVVAMTLIVSWFRYRAHRQVPGVPVRDPAQEQRLARIESAVEAIAIEVERISEGQRFTTKLLSERQGGYAPIGAGEPVAIAATQREGRHHAT